MSLTPDEAANSLKEIDRTGRRSASAYGYAHSSPYFVMWGVIWMIGYSASDVFPHQAGSVWIALTVAGAAGSMAIGRYRGRSTGVTHPGSTRKAGWRFLATFFVIFLFIAAVYAVMGHVTPAQQAAFVPLVVALFYALLGIWEGGRFLIAGAVIAALTLGGFFWLHEHFMLWMAAVGGSALVLAGLWLRTV